MRRSNAGLSVFAPASLNSRLILPMSRARSSIQPYQSQAAILSAVSSVGVGGRGEPRRYKPRPILKFRQRWHMVVFEQETGDGLILGRALPELAPALLRQFPHSGWRTFPRWQAFVFVIGRWGIKSNGSPKSNSLRNITMRWRGGFFRALDRSLC